ncbi:MAG: hypothetical protein E7266_00585 [Lachnospiraceae bacterium]|nr:hypothetical protein [Lachnospiraceae bacterium]
MKIREISCKQFAGIRDKSLSFEDGINVVYGKNETGKSTMVNLLSRTLFQNAKIDSRTDKTFKELYFPGKIKDSNISGDFIDGKVTLEAAGETYIIEKEWGAEAHHELSAPVGRIRDREKIDEILKEVLVYGEGVYTDLLLSSQRNSDISLEALLDVSKKTDAKQEITDVVTKAFAESDGISIDMVAQAIDKKIEEIEGSHWNYEECIPQKRSSRWASGLGEILKAYYDYEDKKSILEQIATLEREADRAIDVFRCEDEKLKETQAHFDDFNAYAGKLKEQSTYKNRAGSLEQELKRYEMTLKEWPEMEEKLKKAISLKKEKEDRDALDRYNNVKILHDAVMEAEKAIEGKICPTLEELKCVKTSIKEMDSCINKLSGINISAKLRMLSGNDVEITSVRTGEKLDIEEGNVHIEEAVNILIPGIMEIQLSPADIDADILNEKIRVLGTTVDSIYKKYGVNSVEELETLAEKYTYMKKILETEQQKFENSLGSETYDSIKDKAEKLPAVIREKAEIEEDITSLTEKGSLESFIAGKEALINRNEDEYTGINGLKEKINCVMSELDGIKDCLKDLDDIPKEYRELSDWTEYLEELNEKVKVAQKDKEDALACKTAAVSRLEAYAEKLEGDPEADVEEAGRKFEELKELLVQWKHIKEVFLQKKAEMSGNPMEDIAERFTHYLDLITGGKVVSEFPRQDKLDMNIYSSNRLMDYGKLSEGTKETVSIAFRLAVLEHLFPNGDGVAVFDDPFNNMDAERMAAACKLVKEFAKRHQVIFLTCKEEYGELLGGKLIRI